MSYMVAGCNWRKPAPVGRPKDARQTSAIPSGWFDGLSPATAVQIGGLTKRWKPESVGQ